MDSENSSLYVNSLETGFLESEVGIKEEQDVNFVIPKKFEVNRLCIQTVKKEDQVSKFCYTFPEANQHNIVTLRKPYN